jgi:hypothetical protein
MMRGRLPFFGMVLLCALSLSLGWGIRGNFGHAYGALIPGVLAALAAVLLAGREDWWRRAPYFALFGALGWSFGGTISYMWVIAYTHSGHLPSQVYGFACLGVIGFTWAALGGAGTALPACLDGERLSGFFMPLLAVFAAWFLQDVGISSLGLREGGAERHQSILYWYDTSWLAALTAPLGVLALAAARRRLCWGSRFILALATGWWVAFLGVVFLVDVVGVEFRMTPPRGDNWAGALGMMAGAWVVLWRGGLQPVVRASLITGIFGGVGFAAATFLKLVEVKYVPLALSSLFGASAWQTNWHSVLEQTYGLLNGVGVGVAMAGLARRAPRLGDESGLRPWTRAAAVVFVLLGITYLNLVKNVSHWVQLKAVPAQLYGLPSRLWFDLGYGTLAACVLLLLARHYRSRLAVIPESSLGQAQLLYLVLLWWVVLGNLMRAIPPFGEERLITEGVIHANAVLCTLLGPLGPPATDVPDAKAAFVPQRSFAGLAGAGLAVLAVTVVVTSAGTRAIYGNAFAGHAGYPTRFGPDAKAGKPNPDEPHP